MSLVHSIETDIEFIRTLKKAGGENLKRCYQCATCSAVCNLSPSSKPFPRKEMILAGWGQSEELVRDPDVWLCYQCNDCTIHCPREARPGDVLAAIRSYTYQHFSFPSFMGKALARPGTLPLLLLIPAFILAACILLFAPRTESGGFRFLASDSINFNLFLPHGIVDALFVIGNIVIFIFAAVGFIRFWKSLRRPGDKRELSLFTSLVLTIKEIISHNRFSDCGTNQPRRIGHMLLLFGFVGAMVTTGAIFFFSFLPHYLSLLGLENIHGLFEPPYDKPIDFPHPVKILGALSGLALVIGGVMLIYRRLTNRDEVGANGYSDYLFLYMLFFTGLTGMLSWLTRLAGVSMFAYSIYFLHIVCVYFLLWYMPYSKFAHMIYRTLALIHARSVGRLEG